MKTKLKSILALILALALVFAFTACGSGSSASTANTSEPTEAPEESSTQSPSESATEAPAEEPEDDASRFDIPLTDEPVEISVWISYNPGAYVYMENGMASSPTYEELQNRTNIYFNWQEFHPETAAENFNIAMAAQEYADVYIDGVKQYTAGADAAIADEIYLNVVDLMDECPNLAALFESDPESKKVAYTDTGKLAGFPQFYTHGQLTQVGPITAQEWLDAYGKDAPQTFAEYEDYLTFVKTNYGATMLLPAAGVPGNYHMVNGYDVAGQVSNVHGITMPFYQVNGEVKFGPIEEGFRDYLTMIHDWYSKGLINPNFMSQENPMEPEEEFISTGESSIFYGSMSLSTYSAKTDNTLNYVSIPDAVKEVGQKTHFGAEQLPVNAIYWCISTQCECPELVTRMFNYMYSEEGSFLMNYGIEGLTYEMVDGEPVYTELLTHNDQGMTMDMAVYCYVATNAPYVMNVERQFQAFNEVEMACLDNWNSEDRDNDYLLPSQISLTSDESSEYSLLVADIITYLSEQIGKFITGENSLDDFDAFVEELEGMDIARCIEIQQAAYDRYIAR